MGVVYEAVDTETRSRVALKTLGTLTPDYLLRLKNEFRTAQDTRHENLLTVSELVEDGGHWYVVMELVDGKSLFEYVCPGASAVDGELAPTAWMTDDTVDLERDAASTARMLDPTASVDVGPFDEDRVREVFAQLCQGLMALHATGKVHRDIKPANVLVTEQGRVVIIDFGLVAELSDLAGENLQRTPGTAVFMAPEQLSGRIHEIGPATDWYAVGTVLYLVLTGRLPFVGSKQALVRAKQSASPLPPRSFSKNVPDDLEELCLQLLHPAPAKRPEGPEILRAVRERRQPAETHAGRRESQVPFVGRREELARLDALFQQVVATRTPQIAYVDGESGVGKSALMREFLERLENRSRDERARPLVLSSRCYPQALVPFNAIDGLIDALSWQLSMLSEAELGELLPASAAPLAIMFPVLRRGPLERLAQASMGQSGAARQLRVEAFAQLRRLLAALAARRPIVLAIDDFQWADADSLALLVEILGSGDDLALLTVATVRGPDRMSDRRRDLWPRAALSLRLSRLSQGETQTLAAALVSDRGLPERFAERIANASAGHPLFLSELSKHLQAREDDASTLQLDEAIWSRISSLPEAERRLVELLSIAAQPLTLGIASQALGCDITEISTTAARLRVSHLVRAEGRRRDDRVETYHDRIRESVLAHVGPARASALHHQVADALECQEDPDIELLLYHWECSGDLSRGFDYAVRAGDYAFETLAFARAARLYRKALAFDPPADKVGPLLESLADALTNAGRGSQAGDSYLEAAAAAQSAPERIRIKRKAADQYLRSGRIDDGLLAFDEVLASVGDRLPRNRIEAFAKLALARARLRVRGLDFELCRDDEARAEDVHKIELYQGVCLGIGMVDQLCSAVYQTLALLQALDTGAPRPLAVALAAEATFVAFKGTRGRARVDELVTRAEQLAGAHGDHRTKAWVLSMNALALQQFGEFSEARRRFEEGVRLIHLSTGAFWDRDTFYLFLLEAMCYQGDFRAMATLHRQLLKEAEERGNLWATVTLKSGFSNMLWLVRDRPHEAREVAEQAHASWTLRPFDVQNYYQMLALAHVELYEGDCDGALERLATSKSSVRRALLFGVTSVRIEFEYLHGRALLARAAGLAGLRKAAALHRALQCARKLDHEQSIWATAMAEQLRGTVARLEARPSHALDHLERAATLFAECSMHMHRAALDEAVGRLYPDLEDAHDRRERALEWAREQGVVAPQRLFALHASGLSEQCELDDCESRAQGATNRSTI